MSLFVDASAAVALITAEAEAPQLEARLEADPARICSALSAWEAMSALVRSFGIGPDLAHARIASFFREIECSFVTIGEAEFGLAAKAYARFGKGIDPAGLNMGDCFAYACAKAHDARLLYKGRDFDRTDLAWPSA